MKISASCMDEATETIFIALESGMIMYFIDLGMVAGSFYHVKKLNFLPCLTHQDLRLGD